MSKKTNHKTTQRVAVSISDIPPDFVPMSSFGNHRPDLNPPRPSTKQYDIILAAWTAQKIDGYKLMRTVTDKRGPVYVSKKQADELIAKEANDRLLRFPNKKVRVKTTPAPNLAGLLAELEQIQNRVGNLIAELQTEEQPKTETDLFTLQNK